MKQIKHPCLPLGLYQHAFGWIIKKTETNQSFKTELLELISRRVAIIENLEITQQYNTQAFLNITDSVYPFTDKLKKAGMENEAHLLWHYACISAGMFYIACCKNLGVQPDIHPIFSNRLLEFQTWPKKIISEKEYETYLEKNYSKPKLFIPAMLKEEKMAHTAMKHFMQNPTVIQKKHIDGYLNYRKKLARLSRSKN